VLVELSDVETWRWIWLIAAVVLAVGEIALAGTFFLLPFAIGAAVAAVLGFLGVGIAIQWVAFAVISVACLVALRPLARRLDAEGPLTGVGAFRQVGQQARVVEAIDPAVDGGFVMLGSERWRAESATGAPIPVGAAVTVTEVRGTRVIVTLATDPWAIGPAIDPSGPPTA
jgi:membrane protein implicated in regulation of membrane protease activity